MNKKLIFLILILCFGSFYTGFRGKYFIKKKINQPIKTFLRINITPVIRDYKLTDCPKNSFAIATFGQSNSANSVKQRSELIIPKNLYQYDWLSEECYKYQEPLLGTTSVDGNVFTYTAVKIANELNKPVIVIPFGIDGTSVLE